jgi:hypothetical protein
VKNSFYKKLEHVFDEFHNNNNNNNNKNIIEVWLEISVPK